MMREPVLLAEGLSRQFGYRPVIREASCALRSGDALLLTGPNGSGKTTLLRMLAGLLRPSGGRVVRRAVVEFVGHDAMVYDALTGRENLRFFARLHRRRDGVDSLLELLDLADRGDDRAATYSRGMLQRLAIARALLADPGILLLDEPLTGLDVTTTGTLQKLLLSLRDRGTAMVMVTHQVADLEPVATHRAHIAAGTLSHPEAVAHG